MAVMQALLQIKADVTGEGQIQKLGQALGGLQQTAGKVSGGLKGLLGAAGGLSGALGALAPAVTGVGLVAMAKSAIDAADDMNDLAQKTGVSVEQLSRFKQAADASGTSVEAVGGAMLKLGRNMATGNDGAAQALKELEISATDASGKLRTTDQVMLDVADRFAKMEDGGRKSALAVQLFGKAGADMIPLLNGGRDAVEGLSATMSTKFAQSADQLNDKMVTLQTGLTQLGVTVGTALMPVLNVVADGVIAVADGFARLPGPVQAVIGGVVALTAAFVVLAPAISAIVSLAGVIGGLQIGATIAGWLGAVGPFIVGFQAALAGLLAWVGGTFIPALVAFFSGPVGWTVLAVAAVVAMVVLFRKPIMDFFAWLGGAIAQGVQAIWQWGEPIRAFWAGVWDGVATAVTKAFETISGIVRWALEAIYAIAFQLLVQPWINLWNNVLREPVTALWEWLKGVWGEIAKFWQEKIATPIQKAWEYLTGKLQEGMQKAVSFVRGIWDGMIKSIRGVINSFLSGWANAINSAINGVNRLIAAFNRLPGPDIGLIPNMSVPQFAEGGVVDRPTLAMVGEGGEREYIIPESKMGAAASAYLSGARGASVLGPSTINVTTGPVLQQQGQTYVTMADLQRAMRATEAGTLARIRTPAGRSALGIR